MPDPYRGSDEALLKTLEDKDWVYEREFFVEDEISGITELVFEGIDTLAEVYLNDVFIGKCEDMFLTYRFDVRKILKNGKNNLRVVIRSPVREPEKLERVYGELNAAEEKVRGYVRKAQYSYGWDWGLRLPVSGIWRSVYIESYTGRLQNCTANLSSLNGEKAEIRAAGDVYGEGDAVEVYMDEKRICAVSVSENNGEKRFEGLFSIIEPRLWYPRGLGAQHLYEFVFSLRRGEKEVYSERKRIGLREVKLLQESDEEGKSFIFVINGKRVFAKGANWVPCDNMLTRATQERYRELVKMALGANMNMLRVWGGGIYENEAFYDACDELGIMVWQDFMFACSEYPDNLPWFRELADKEVRETVKRMRFHASIVLWCGNNENNWGFEEWGWKRRSDGYNLGNRLYLIDFPRICADEDGTRPYWPSSPYGYEKANEESSGDMHVWNVWSGWEDYGAYGKNHGRFISEFGFQGFPDERTSEAFEASKEEIFDENMLRHNRQKEGMERCLRYVNSEFGSFCDLHSMTYLSQMAQAEAIRYGVEHWRIRKYRTAGTLFWQLNDSWPVVSWSAIDYFGRPKALYYYAGRFFADVLPMVRYHEGAAEVYMVSDLRETKKATISVELFNMNGERTTSREYEVTLPEDSVTEIAGIEIKDPSDTVCYISTLVDGIAYENCRMFGRFRDLRLKDPEIEMDERDGTVSLTCKRPALGVRLRCDSADDNFFFLKPEETKKVRVRNVYGVESVYDYMVRE
jgi:beta-mannosidase